MALQTIENPVGDHKDGNNFFKKQRYLEAIEAYSRAIKDQPDNVILYSNRAISYLKVDRPEMALEDSENCLKCPVSLSQFKVKLKLLCNKATAMIRLKMYEEAASFMEKASREEREAMKDKAFANLVKASKRIAEEAKTGNYDIIDMMEEAKQSPLLDNHADFFAMDKFEIMNIPGKGRGLVAKEFIEAGTLLMASKAFVFAESFPLEPMVQKASHKLSNNPKLGVEFYKLYAGKEFGCLENTDHLKKVDSGRILGIIRLNMFIAKSALDISPNSKGKTYGGVWIMPSYINHSCVDINCFRFVIGDFMFIRTIKDINPGDELLHRYVSPWKQFDERCSILTDTFGFTCLCRLCEDDRNRLEKVRKHLKKIGEDVEEIADGHVKKGSFELEDVANLKKLLKQAESEVASKEVNFVAQDIRAMLAVASDSQEYRQQLYEEMFQFRRGIDDMHLAFVYAKMLSIIVKDVQLQKWLDKTKDLAKIMYGDERVMDRIKVQ